MAQYSINRFLSSFLSARADRYEERCILISTDLSNRPLFGVEASLRHSTPLTLKEPRACQRKLPCVKCTRRVRQTVPQEFAEFQGSCAGRGADDAATAVSIDRSIERTNQRTNLSETSQLRGVEAPFGGKVLGAQNG